MRDDGRVTDEARLWFEHGGSDGGRDDGPVLVLLHGLGHTGEVWRPLLGALPPETAWLVVDLPGHGRSPWFERYRYYEIAGAVAAVLPPDRPVLAVGHSFGGAIALALAGICPRVGRVLGFGIKVHWLDDELAAMRDRAARPPKVFPTEAEARAAFVRFAGLSGVAAPESDFAASGVAPAVGGHRLATDPRSMGVGAPDMPALLAGARASAEVRLAAGEHDGLVSADQLRALDPDAVVLPGVGHNVHVTDPRVIVELIMSGPSSEND